MYWTHVTYRNKAHTHTRTIKTANYTYPLNKRISFRPITCFLCNVCLVVQNFITFDYFIGIVIVVYGVLN